jgi:hypothetical protein
MTPHTVSDNARPEVPNNAQPGIADDLLRGAGAIAEFLFGSREFRRKVYHLAEYTRIPVFRLGSVLCARKSVLLTWIAGQESLALPVSAPDVQERLGA